VRHARRGRSGSRRRGRGGRRWRSVCGLAARERSSAGAAAAAWRPQQAGRLRRASDNGLGDTSGAERADAGAREACASARRPEQSEQGERARRRRRAAHWSGRPRARGDVAARVSAGSVAGGRGGGVAVQSDGARRRSCGGGLLREMRERGGIDPD
jgi:hypothetical protein